jgi:glycosyltransferase involved in cell wall biosynthesis
VRVAQIAPPWIPVPPCGYGGIELVVDVLARGLQSLGHEVTLFAAEGSRSSARIVSPLPAPGAAAIGDAYVEGYHALSAYLLADEFDLVHDHTFFGPALAGVRAGNTPVVHTLHGPWERRMRRYFRLLDSRVHLVAISAAQRRNNPAARYAATIPHGLELDRYPLHDGPRNDFLLYIGRANRDKAPELAVELAHRAEMPLKLLVKRAEEAEQRYWERQVEPLLGPDDEVLEELDHEQKLDLLRRGRAFVFPIRWQEPFGLVMIEALACGMPVVATPCGAATEIVEDGVSGFLRRDLDGLTAALRDIERIPAQACRARVESRFSADEMLGRYDRLFGMLARGEAETRRGRSRSNAPVAPASTHAPTHQPAGAPSTHQPAGAPSTHPGAGNEAAPAVNGFRRTRLFAALAPPSHRGRRPR